MYIAEITFRSRNDFHFIAFCRHCRKKSWHGDGYADAFYQKRVFPARHCEHCGLDGNGNALDVARSVLDGKTE
jgi:hypothetical protein